MKKILFSLVALVCSMSMNAQVLKVMKDGEVVKKYNGANYEFVFEEAPGTTGSSKRTGDIEVNWVQLWEDGPRFAEYNVGATSVSEYGGLYAWGGSQDKGTDKNTGSETLLGDNDTATKLWGSNWRMPTKTEFDALIANCNVTWTDNYNNSGVKGSVFTGKDDYSNNSVFFPVAGGYSNGEAWGYEEQGFYWSSTTENDYTAKYLMFYKLNNGGNWFVTQGFRDDFSVRAVLAEE